MALASMCVWGQQSSPPPIPEGPEIKKGQLPDKDATEEQAAKCRLQSPMESKTYTFRRLKLPPEDISAFGVRPKKKWYAVIFPWLAPKGPEDNWNNQTISALLKHTGERVVPLGESQRSYDIRKKLERFVMDSSRDSGHTWEQWLAENPNVSEAEKRRARIRRIDIQAAKRQRFDWVEEGLDVGRITFQGWDCNACWAFASVDALRASRDLIAIRTDKPDPDPSLIPSGRQLMSCMLPKPSDMEASPEVIAKKRCTVNWHTDNFTYFVTDGIPLGGATGFVDKRKDMLDWTCDAPFRERAMTWNYVTTEPGEVPSEETLKQALILYGPIVATLTTDACLTLYGGGIFNEVVNKDNDSDPAHIILIIGWDDKKIGTDGKPAGAWLVKNGYGEEWGEKGYGWVKYGSNNIGRNAAWVMADPEAKLEPMKLKK